MRHTITQEDSMGCGAACVAFAAHVSYKNAASTLGKIKAKTTGFHLKELVEGLRVYELFYKSSHMNRLTKEFIRNEGVIIFIRRSKRYPFGHYLIRHGDVWMDPWINLTGDANIDNAKSGYRQIVPGEVQWVVYPE